MLLNWSRRFPLVKGKHSPDWCVVCHREAMNDFSRLVKTVFYISVLYGVPMTDKSFGHPNVARVLLRALFMWAFFWRAWHKVCCFLL